jgi:hypothetical protein
MTLQGGGELTKENSSLMSRVTAAAQATAGSGGIGGTSPAESSLKAGVSEIKAGAPKTFNINITKLIENQTIETTTFDQAPEKIREAVLQALLGATNDLQIIAD